MNYFILIPSELNEIILSYSYIDGVKTLLNTFNLRVNWSIIHTYHFNEYISISIDEYLNKLGIENLRDKLILDYTINELINLQELDLTNSQLTQVPPEIGYLTNLQKLWFGNNKLTLVPPEIGRLTNLRTLFLSSNQLTQVPP